MRPAGVGVRDALDSAVIAIAASGCDTPRLDAELLLAHVLEVDRSALITDSSLQLRGPAVRAFQDAVRRRAVEREPVAYILGRRGFRYIDLEVDGRVLIPRPESELLVEIALELPRGVRVIDVGTGSGAIALALKHERPDLELIGTDVSDAALVVARANAVRLRLDVAFVAGDLLAGVDGADAVLSNPPYVADGERAVLAPEIVRHEPAGAVFAGADGLEVIRRLVPAAAAARMLAIELGRGQAPAVTDLMRAAGRTAVAHRDLAGIERVVVGLRCP